MQTYYSVQVSFQLFLVHISRNVGVWMEELKGVACVGVAPCEKRDCRQVVLFGCSALKRHCEQMDK